MDEKTIISIIQLINQSETPPYAVLFCGFKSVPFSSDRSKMILLLFRRVSRIIRSSTRIFNHHNDSRIVIKQSVFRYDRFAVQNVNASKLHEAENVRRRCHGTRGRSALRAEAADRRQNYGVSVRIESQEASFEPVVALGQQGHVHAGLGGFRHFGRTSRANFDRGGAYKGPLTCQMYL